MSRVRLALLVGVLTGISSVVGVAMPHAGVPAVRVHAYVLFDGNGREAMTFYQSVLGGSLEVQAVAETPMSAAFPRELQGRTVHAKLVAPGIELSGSDWLAPHDTPLRGNMTALYIEGGTHEATRALFEALSRGGTVTTPFARMPYGWYGRLIDAYGVVWMFHASGTGED